MSPEPRRSAAGAVPLLFAAMACLALVKSPLPRVLLPLGLVAVAIFVILRARRAPDARPGAPSPASRRSRRGIELSGDRLAFRGAGRTQPLLDLGEPFGLTLLATPRRDRAVALLSSASGTFYVGARFDPASRRAAAELLDRATTVGGDDIGLEAIGPDGDPLVVSAEDFTALHDALAAESPLCLERFVLTDARGAELSLDGRELSVAGRIIDLDAPLEWRAIVFQEAFGQAVAVYQGTWIRQSGTELVLVCLLPSLGPPGGADLDLGGGADGAPRAPLSVLRDLRLMQASPEQPPPPEQRVAIDRLFMVPVRSALDRAPRPSQTPSREGPMPRRPAGA